MTITAALLGSEQPQAADKDYKDYKRLAMQVCVPWECGVSLLMTLMLLMALLMMMTLLLVTGTPAGGLQARVRFRRLPDIA